MKALFFVIFPILAASIGLASGAHAEESTYECYRYVDGHPTGTWINVKASSKAEAENKAYARFKDLGGKVDGAKCH